MASSTSKLLPELIILHRLTETEAMIAQTRRVQATNKTVERELARNAQKCSDRAASLRQAIVDLGGVPDVVGTAIGRANATAKATVEQGQTFTTALLGDLALEHQLQDRARFLKVLAETADETKTAKLAERLVNAHGETIDWINIRLAEVAVGGPADIRPTPTQVAVSAGIRFAALPSRQLAGSVNRAFALARKAKAKAANNVEENVDKARQLRDSAVEVVTAGRNAALKRSEQEARKDGDKKTADTVHRTRSNLGVLSSDELPIKGYDDLSAENADKAINKLTRASDVRAILAYELENKNRKGVSTTAQVRIEDLAKELSNA
ncbi:MAG: ferritin-like domain-containing protein [Actinomycetota bacterium]|nr:ferritin-like domain-containing protein [Actinomycetota bacterium]